MCLQSSILSKHGNFHDWFSVLSYNSDLEKLELTPLLLTSTRSVICQIEVNCSPLQSLNMLPFYIRPERLKMTYYSVIQKFCRYYFDTDTPCLLFLSWHVFATWEFDSNYFGILLWKIVKPREYNETKPPIAKIFRNYKPVRHYFVMSRK